MKRFVTPVAPVRLEQRGRVVLADFGKAVYGNLQIGLPSGARAATLTVRLGERLGANGAIDCTPPGSVNVREILLHTRPGGGDYRLDIPPRDRHRRPPAVRMPLRIGEVTPFRYAELEGSPVPPDQLTLRQLFVHAPFDDTASAFTSSSKTLNAVWDLCKHTIKATTAFGVYIDGERERIPYEADAYLNQLSHYAVDLDPRVARRTITHLLKHPTWPTEWSLHMPLMAVADYDATGSLEVAANHYDALRDKLLLHKARADGLLRAGAIVDWPPGERDGYHDGQADPADARQIGPEINTVVNAFHYRALQCMARLAHALHRRRDAAQFTARAARVQRAFQRAFFDRARGIYRDGEGSTHASLHANLFPLAFDLVPASSQDRVADFVESRGMACSVYAAQYLLEALFRAGRDTAALALMTSRSRRSWWHMLAQGSTMTLEAWNERVKPNLTWNHAWGAAPANILARYVLGVRPLEPGYGRMRIAPRLGNLQWVRGTVPTPRGPVTVCADRRLKSVSMENGRGGGI